MGLWRSFSGMIRIKIISADISGALKRLTDSKILLQDVIYETYLRISVTVRRQDYKKITQLLSARGDRCEIEKKWGAYWLFQEVINRPILITGFAMLVFSSLFIPSRIFFIQVQGNHTVPTAKIVETAQDLGLSFGCDRAKIQNEQMKNALLEAIPQLDWAGITTSGCVASIEVKENLIEEPRGGNPFSVSSLVAVCDGVVESITATDGMALCQPGQAVRRGQVLISGYVDLGLVIKATRAQGEVYAKSFRTVQAISPAIGVSRDDLCAQQTDFSLQIGKKQINFFQDSGISPVGCVKMYSKRYLTLPGGFQLPVALVTEKYYVYTTDAYKADENAFFWMEAYADQYIQRQMIAGEVLYKKSSSEMLDDVYVLWSEYSCREQIALERHEESLNIHGENS